MDKRFDEILVEHKDVFLFECAVGRIMFRLLPYQKYAVIKHSVRTYPNLRWALEDDIWEECVIEHTFDSGVDNLPAGIVSVVAQLILKFSCSQNTEEANIGLNSARAGLQDAVQQAIIFVCEAFPSYLPEDLETKSWNQILIRLAQAEVILGKSFEFKDSASQKIDDSDKIFKELNELSMKNMDFMRDNQELMTEEFSAPKGNFNLRDARSK